MEPDESAAIAAFRQAGRHGPKHHIEPCVWHEEALARAPARYSESTGFWLLARYDDVEAAAGDPATFPAEVLEGLEVESLEVPVPHKGHFRRITERRLSAAQVMRWEPAFARLAQNLVDGFAERGDAELVSELVIPYTTAALAHVLGFGSERGCDFRRLQERLLQAWQANDVEEEDAVLRSLVRLIAGEIEDRVAHPEKNDLLGAVVHSTVSGQPLTVSEVEAYVLTLSTEGLEPTVISGRSLLRELAIRNDLRTRLVNRPGLISKAVDELLRLASPVPAVYRTTAVSVTIGEEAVPAGARIALVYSAANRDPARFPRADDVVLNREREHLAFGSGPHRCLGAHLTRSALKVLVEQVLSTIPDMHSCEPAGSLDASWESSSARTDLRVRFTSRRKERDSEERTITIPTPSLVNESDR